MPKFKIGQKVRIKEWVDMPEEVLVDMGIACHIGDVGTIVRDIGTHKGYKAYDVRTEIAKHNLFCFEGELEPLIKVGQQLTFSFMEE